MMLSILHVSVGYLYVFFEKMFIQDFCPFLNWVICYFAVELCEFLVYLDINLLSDMWFSNIFSIL